MSGRITLDSWAWAQEARRRCGSAGVALVFDPYVQGPQTDGKTIRIPPLPENATADDLAILRHAVIHECGHHLRPEALEIAKRERLKPESPLMVLLNIVEDAAQERAVAEKWRGDCASLSAGHRTICSRQIELVTNDPSGAGPVADSAHKYAAAMGASLVAASDWSRDMETLAEPWALALDKRMPGTAALFSELIAEGWDTKIRAAISVQDAWRVARELFARLFPGEKEEDSKADQKEGKGEAGDAKKGKPKPGKRPGEGKPEAGEEEDGEPAGGIIPWELIYHSDHFTDESDAAASAVTRIDFTGKPVGGAPTWYTDKTVEKPRPSGAAVAAATEYKFPAGLIGEVRRLLQAKARVRWDHERTEGRLDKRNLTRVIMPRVGDGTFNRSVFQRRAESLSLDVCVTVLVDCSGSMSGRRKFEHAAEAAMCLNDLADVSLRVPCEIVGFTTHPNRGDAPRYYEFKPYGERRVARSTVGARLLELRQMPRALWGNADGDAVLWAASRMKPRREARKILIVLSDGSPTESAPGGDADVNLTAAIGAVRAGGDVEVYGIGIMDDNVRRYYSPKAPVIQDAAGVPAALVEVLADVLQRGARKGQ